MARKSRAVSIRESHLVADFERRGDPGFLGGIDHLVRVADSPFGEICGVLSVVI